MKDCLKAANHKICVKQANHNACLYCKLLLFSNLEYRFQVKVMENKPPKLIIPEIAELSNNNERENIETF